MLRTVLGPSLRWRLIRSGAFLATGLAFAAPVLGFSPPLMLRNDGASMPLGYYVYSHAKPAQRGEVAVLRDPPHFNMRWLMKRVEGVAGDWFCWQPELGTHTLNFRPMSSPLPEARAMGIPVWQGCRELQPGEIVGYGISRDSYDSRYLGPVRESDLWGVYAPVWVGA